MCSSDQRPAMLLITASASSVVAQPCSPARGLRTRSSECWPPRQWIVRMTSRASSSTSTMMSVINVRSSCWRARIVTPGAFQAADRLSAKLVKAFGSTVISDRLCSGLACLQISDAPERGLPVLLQLRGNEAIVRIAGRVATLGQACLVTGLLHFQVPDTLLVFLLFPVHPLRLERGIDRHWFHRHATTPGRSRHRPAGRRRSCSAVGPS